MIIIKEIPIIEAAANDETPYNLYHFVDRFEGTLDHKEDEDWIRVDLVAGETYEINLAGSGDNGAADTILEVFNSDGERVARNDDIDTAGGNLNSMVTFTPDSSGVYYISASSYTANPAQDNSGDYEVTVAGRGDSERLVGSIEDDELNGDAGDDSLEGSAGADMLRGGGGFDIASYRTSDAGVEVSLQDGTGTGGHAEGDTLDDIEALEGSDHDDVLTGDDGANWLFGNAGNDELDGGEGDDWIYGGPGFNELEGGAGADLLIGMDGVSPDDFDTASYKSSDAGVEVRLGEGVTLGGHAEGDSLFGIEGIWGSAHDDVLMGDFGGNWLVGDAGDDVLISGGNDGGVSTGYIDLMIGGPGADTLIGGDGFDLASYIMSEAGVEVRLYDGTAKGGEAEGDTFESIEGLVGSNNDDILVGDQGSNSIFGFGGNDIIEGREGDDYLAGDSFEPGTEGGDDELYGGEGNDGLVGGPGDDSLDGGEGDDFLDGGPGTDMLDGGEGNDFLQGAEDDDELHGKEGQMTNSMVIIMVAYSEKPQAATTNCTVETVMTNSSVELVTMNCTVETVMTSYAARKAPTYSAGALVLMSQFTTRVQTPAW